jgi:hypothetical protein
MLKIRVTMMIRSIANITKAQPYLVVDLLARTSQLHDLGTNATPNQGRPGRQKPQRTPPVRILRATLHGHR